MIYLFPYFYSILYLYCIFPYSQRFVFVSLIFSIHFHMWVLLIDLLDFFSLLVTVFILIFLFLLSSFL